MAKCARKMTRGYALGGLMTDQPDPLGLNPVQPPVQKAPSPLQAMDQQIAKNSAFNGLSNTERYQLDNPGNQPYKASGAAPGSSAEASQLNQQNSILSTVRDNLANQKIAGFADGGPLKETPDQLIARISGKYGVSGNSTPAPAPAPVSAPAQQIAQPAKGIGGVIQVIKGRQAQIDNAINGYSCGGKVQAHANGGMISGPGTPTSDSIPAKVRETGENIAVSNKERIVSAGQDALLQKIAKGIGFKNLDALLEAGTGKPVGPTIKAGKKAAATGLDPSRDYSIPEDQQVSARQAIATMPAYVPPVEAPVDAAKNFRNTDFSMVAADPKGFEAVRRTVAPATPTATEASAAIRSHVADTPIQRGAQERTFKAMTTGQRIGTLPTANTQAQTGADNYRPNQAQNGVGDGVFTQDGKTYRQQATSQEGISKITSPGTSPLFTNLDGGAAVSGLNSRSSPELFVGADGKPTTHWNETQDYKDALARNERNATLATQMERDRYGRDMQSDVTDPRTIGLARLNLDRMNTEQAGENQTQQLQQQAITAGLDQQLKRGTLASSDKITQMIGQLDNPDLSPEQRNDLRSNLLVAQGKNPNEHRFIPLDETVYDDMGRPTSKTGFALDTLTGNRMGGTAAAAKSLPAPKSEAEMKALPKGTKYTAPDGSVRVKP